MISFRKLSLAVAGGLLVSLSFSAFAGTKAQLQNLEPQVKQLAAQSDVIAAVNAANTANAKLSKSDIRTLGQQWHDGVKGKTSAILNQVNSSALSASLKTVQSQSNGAYAGIVVTDNKGLIVGQTYNADHYSQANRNVWSKISKDGVNAVYFGKSKVVNGQNVASIGVPIVQNNQVIGAVLVNTGVASSAANKKSAHSGANS